MHTLDTGKAFRRVFSELVAGTNPKGGYVLNTDDIGLLQSLEKISAADASRAVNGGATIAAHTQHLRYGLSLMNEWATKGGNPFANAKWDEAWKMSAVNDAQWREIQAGLRDETSQWLEVLKTPREMSSVEFTGLVGSIAHLAYHLGAVRQIAAAARGPREGTFS